MSIFQVFSEPILVMPDVWLEMAGLVALVWFVAFVAGIVVGQQAVWWKIVHYVLTYPRELNGERPQAVLLSFIQKHIEAKYKFPTREDLEAWLGRPFHKTMKSHGDVVK